jgi:Alr-MurF fusion protein
VPGYSPTHIAQVLQCEANIMHNDEIRFLLTDSRRIIHAEDSLFFAIVGAFHNGHDYIGGLLKAGVRNFVVEHLPDLDCSGKANFFVVENAVKALQDLATHHRRQFSYPVIGITGSNGKTIVKEWLFQVMEGQRQVVRNPRSFNSQVGVPLSVWNMDVSNDMAVFEAGISLPGEMGSLEKTIRPTLGIFTNIGDAHQENFSDMLEKAKEKSQLFINVEWLVYCSDYKEIEQAVHQTANNGKTQFFTWSMQERATLSVLEVQMVAPGTQITANYGGADRKISIPFTDKGSIENAIHVWCVLLHLGWDDNLIENRMMQLQPVEMRLMQKKAINGCTLINDSYNSDLNSLSIAMDFLGQQHQHARKTLILSDIQQSGKNTDALYHEVSMVVNNKKIDRFIGIGPEIARYSALFKGMSQFYPSTDEFLKGLDISGFHDESILIKGARHFRFEEVEKRFIQKVHRTVLQIDMDAVIHNFNYFKALVKPKTKIMAMVKAVSYGSGTFEIAHLLHFHRVDYLGVAYTNEGIDLRQAGVNTPIMVMNPEHETFGPLIDYGLEPEIYSFETLKAFLVECKLKGERQYPVHIKLDSGMHRLGFMPNDAKALTEALANNPYIRVKSIFSHLAASDDLSFERMTRKQIRDFEEVSLKIMEHLEYPVLRHILNSSGIVNYPEAEFDMVRLGIGLYGFAASSEGKLKNVFTLKTVLSQIKEISSGDSIGYNPRSPLENNKKMGIIAIGYADGFNRKLGNGVGKVMVKGHLVPVIGNVCMDMCMIDLTGLDDVKEGDEVLVFGQGYTADAMAQQLGTIPYEVITGISQRINRVYYKE